MFRKNVFMSCCVLSFLFVGCQDTDTPSVVNTDKQALEQTNKASSKVNEELQPIDEAPGPVGGLKALQKALVYPQLARKAGIEGRAILSVLIGKDGSPQSVKLLKSSGNESCDQAAIKAVKAVKWNPGLRDGKPVPAEIGIPIVFKLK